MHVASARTIPAGQPSTAAASAGAAAVPVAAPGPGAPPPVTALPVAAPPVAVPPAAAPVAVAEPGEWAPVVADGVDPPVAAGATGGRLPVDDGDRPRSAIRASAASATAMQAAPT